MFVANRRGLFTFRRFLATLLKCFSPLSRLLVLYYVVLSLSIGHFFINRAQLAVSRLRISLGSFDLVEKD